MSYQKTKVDDSLGFEIEQHLRELGVNTPTIPTDTTRQQKIDIIENHVRGILETIGLDLTVRLDLTVTMAIRTNASIRSNYSFVRPLN